MTRILLLLSTLVGVSACYTSQPVESPVNADILVRYRAILDSLPEGYAILTEMPTLIGGIEALIRHLNTGECRAHGETVVEFVVDENGNVLEPLIIQSTSERCDAEVIRLMTEDAKFTPGRDIDGHAVKVKMSLPITTRSR
ncbi:MAG: energy transducer TonB [Bacteroidota bacterium]|nr:energy transducer TonB [Bacteroidota bacterium]MDE2646486.1 energy transducer TonB [Bacteroidota bacterium]MXZ16973.1 hypothetical protein [Rhodothermaceae bacterium]MYG68453.1 hypothetical protein [Rhodothermaceae bacterium]MYJ45011.1 hypothetical protein [Rhodothermaceae bacterium]